MSGSQCSTPWSLPFLETELLLGFMIQVNDWASFPSKGAGTALPLGLAQMTSCLEEHSASSRNKGTFWMFWDLLFNGTVLSIFRQRCPVSKGSGEPQFSALSIEQLNWHTVFHWKVHLKQGNTSLKCSFYLLPHITVNSKGRQKVSCSVSWEGTCTLPLTTQGHWLLFCVRSSNSYIRR